MKNLPAIILLFIANSISGVAQGISMLAIPWYFAQQNDMSRFGLIYILTNVIAFFWVPYSGTFVDKYNRKTLFLFVTAIMGLLLFGISAVGWSMGELPWFLVAFVFMMTFFNYNLHYPNLYAFVQEIAEPAYYGKITSYLEIQGQLTNVLAGGAAALLLEGTMNGPLDILGFELPFFQGIIPWEIHQIFLLDAITYVLGFIIISFIGYHSLVDRSPEEGSINKRLMVGFNYLKKNKKIFVFGVASHTTFVAVLITTFYLSASYVDRQLQSGGDVFALSEMLYALGAVFSGLMIRKVFSKVSLLTSIIIMTIMGSALFAVLATTDRIPIFYLMNFILGITNAGIRIQRVTYLFSTIPNQVYGRSNSIFNLVNISFRILFLSIFGLAFFQQDNHVIYAFAILSVFLLIAAFVLGKLFTHKSV